MTASPAPSPDPDPDPPSAWPDQSGHTAVVTGGSSGLGYVVAEQLASAGAHVILAVRDRARGDAAARRIAERTPGADVEVRPLDLAHLDSVRAFADTAPAADVLVNNAGGRWGARSLTRDGFEAHFGVHHLGHFALTGLLLAHLRPGARIVTVTSNEHRRGVLDLDDVHAERSYHPRAAYRRAKLANTVFGIELERRLRHDRHTAISVLAHPGFAATNLRNRTLTGRPAAALRALVRLLSQSPTGGARSLLHAATAPDLTGATLIGPTGPFELRGEPGHRKPLPLAHDPHLGARLWRVSEELTGVRYLAGRTGG